MLEYIHRKKKKKQSIQQTFGALSHNRFLEPLSGWWHFWMFLEFSYPKCGEINGIQFSTTQMSGKNPPTFQQLCWSPPCRLFQILKGQDSFPLPCPRKKNPPFLGASKLFVSFREGRVKIWKIKAPKFPAISYAKSNVSIPRRIFPIDLDHSIEVLTLISWTMRASMQHGGRRIWAKNRTRFFRKQKNGWFPEGVCFLYPKNP